MDRSSARQALSSSNTDQFVTTMIRVLKSHRPGGAWLTIGKAADLAGISVRTLQRRLAEHDLSFGDLVHNVRKESAIELMTDDELSVDEVASQTGYTRVANFARAFKRWTGKTPTEFRNA